MTSQRESLVLLKHTPSGINEQKRKEKGPMETTQLIKCARESSGNCSVDEDMKCLIKIEVFFFSLYAFNRLSASCLPESYSTC